MALPRDTQRVTEAKSAVFRKVAANFAKHATPEIRAKLAKLERQVKR